MDVSRNEINKYKKLHLLDSEYFEELKKAEICACESYYVASFLYLRRVFENLVGNLFDRNAKEIGINREEFNKKHSNEKLELLKPFLAIEDSVYTYLYKILSEGVHTLSEEKCAENYQLLKFILLDILEEQTSKNRKEENRKKLADLFSRRKDENKNEE